MLVAQVVRKSIFSRFQVTKKQYVPISISINLILAVTLRWWSAIGTPVTFWLINASAWKHALIPDANWLLNCILFIPASFYLTRYLKRPTNSVIFLIPLSFGIETLQGIFLWGASDPADWVANSVGVFIGTLIALQLKKVRAYARKEI